MKFCVLLLLCMYGFVSFGHNNDTVRGDVVEDEEDMTGFIIRDMRLYYNGQRFNIKGLDYSPVPIGASPIFNRPYGDYFSHGNNDLWKRDFPKIRQLGVNTIRVYTWRPDQDHTEFLDFAERNGIKVLATFYLGTSSVTSLATAADQDAAINKFTNETARYANHAALLGWTFGNEINSLVNGFLYHLNQNDGCGWTKDCWSSDAAECEAKKRCIYQALFRLMNEAARRGKIAIEESGGSPKIMATAFADLDNILGYLTDYESLAPEMDAWGFNLYRGKDFGHGDSDILAHWGSMSTKPLMVTEYGVDAYRDYCGVCTDTDCHSPCYENLDQSVDGFGEDETTQADWDGALTKLLIDHWDAGILGGFIMSWVDEYWKGAVAVAGCDILYGKPGFTNEGCQHKAHVNCPHIDASTNSLCGYWLSSTFDNYVNEGWYGLNRVRKGFGGSPDILEPREVYYTIQDLYGGSFYLASPTLLWRQAWFVLAITLLILGVVPLVVFELQLSFKKRSGQLEAGGVGAGYTIVMEEESPIRRVRADSNTEEE